MALGQYSTDYFRSVYHRVFSVKYSDFCILVILVSLQASFRPVIIKQTYIPSMVALPKQIPFKKKLSYPADIARNVLVLKEISIPPELALLCQTVHIRPLGNGDICTCLVRMLHFISLYTHLRTKGHFHISLCSFSINFLQFFLESYK